MFLHLLITALITVAVLMTLRLLYCIAIGEQYQYSQRRAPATEHFAWLPTETFNGEWVWLCRVKRISYFHGSMPLWAVNDWSGWCYLKVR